MLPVVAGKGATTWQILVYSVLLIPVSLLPWALGFAGAIYAATAAICGAIFVALAFQLRRSRDTERRDASRLFVFSIFYLFLLFAALLADHSGGPSILSSHSARTDSASVQAERPACSLRTACSFPSVTADED